MDLVFIVDLGVFSCFLGNAVVCLALLKGGRRNRDGEKYLHVAE